MLWLVHTLSSAPEVRGFMRFLMDLLVAALVLVGLAVVSELVLRREMLEGVAFAVDGDTLDLGGRHVRLAGIDAPELRQECTRDRRSSSSSGSTSWACGDAARRRLEEALRKGAVTCTGSSLDKYGRPLARCVIGQMDLSDLMVREGFAVAYRGRDYAGAEADARAARRGIWSGSFQPPADYRAEHPRTL